MAKSTQRALAKSVSNQVSAFSAASQVLEPPPGVELRSDEERTIWQQFIAARAKVDWRDMDLILLGKVVRLEADLRRYNAMLDEMGPLVENSRGTVVENAILRVIDTCQRQQLALIRSMSLQQMASAPVTRQNHAKAEQDAVKVLKENGIEALLAGPAN